MSVRHIQSRPGEESVWDYPRPPRVEPCSRLIQVRFGGQQIAATHSSQRVLETSHPPVYYLPPVDVRVYLLVASGKRSWCEFKSEARYFDVVVAGRTAPAAAWSYPRPAAGYEALREHLAFYPQAMEGCFVDGEEVRVQEGDFYGGWITSDVVGPFKGGVGTLAW